MLQPLKKTDASKFAAASDLSVPDAPTSIVSLRSVFKDYATRSSGSVTALHDISLNISDGEFVTIVGPSGCGKSTVLKIVGGIIPPSRGEVLFKDSPLTRPSPDVGMVFQRPVLLPWKSVLGNVLFPIEMLGRRVKDYEDTARYLLKLVGLGGFENVYPQELSGGMQQRASICRALVYDPTILLMDEPFGALDALTREELCIELLRIWDERKKTVVFVTHSITEAVFLADRVVVMTPRPGRVVLNIKVDLPRPRTVDMEFSQEFKVYCDQVREGIYASKKEA